MTTTGTQAAVSDSQKGDNPPAMTGRQRVALTVLLTASFTLAVDFSILTSHFRPSAPTSASRSRIFSGSPQRSLSAPPGSHS
jgi:hypothetical protein